MSRISAGLLVASIVVLTPVTALGQAAFYVDASRTANGDGSQSNPWRQRGDIDWGAVQSALASDDVTIYFSSRDTWNDNQEMDVRATGSSSHRLTLDGASKYNHADSGAANWQTESSGSQRAVLTNAGGTGGTVYLREDTAYITIRGFHVLNATWAGITHRNSNSATPYVENIHDIVIENNVVESPVNNGGLYFVYLEAGCHNWTLRGNTVINTKLEPIYLGHYNYLQDSVTGVLLEHNTVIDGGTTGEGDIDLKPPVRGAIVRYNKHYRTNFSANGQLAAIVAYNGDHRIYGNEFYNMKKTHGNEGGHGIYLSTYGDGSTGKTVSNVLIYNNVIYGNEGSAIRLDASRGSIGNLRILNNTFAYNGEPSILSGGGSGITISELKNNIFFNNLGIGGSSEIRGTAGNFTIADSNHNLFWNDNGVAFAQYKSSTPRNWSDWTQVLGFDASGMNLRPEFEAGDASMKNHDQLTNATIGHMTPVGGSAGVGAAADLSNVFSEDFKRAHRNRWDIGAITASGGASTSNPPAPPSNVRIVPGS